MYEDDNPKSKRTHSIIYLVLFLILLILLPIVFFFIACALVAAEIPILVIKGVILYSHFLYLVPAIPQRGLNKKIFIFEIILTIIMFIITLIICITVK
ncbi:MAG: hypothetical protein LKJ25_00055 [Clostridia bacterium]|jgi:hypothetical protein|nr:hypothetical protein [Clostridia bacterium]